MSVSDFVLPLRLDGRNRSPFGDQRLYRQLQRLQSAQRESESVIINQLSRTKGEATGFYRFLSNSRVSISELISQSCQPLVADLSHRHVLLLGDSSSYNLSGSIGRVKDRDRVGVLEDNRSPGFFTHVNLAIDADYRSILGLADVLFWTRKKVSKKTGSKPKAPLTQRESYKWSLGGDHARMVYTQAKRRTYVFDSDADNYDIFAHILDKGDDFVIRSHKNRILKSASGPIKLYDCLSQADLWGSYQIDLPPLDHYSSTHGKRIQRKARRAQLEVRVKPVTLSAASGSKHPIQASVSIWAIEAKEVSGVPEGEAPVCWRILTSHPIPDFQAAQLIIEYYTLRWIIEQLFRIMKKKGFATESTQLQSFDAIVKQTIMAYKMACKVLQLVYEREKFDAQPIDEAFDSTEQFLLEKLNQKYQGKTDKQKNPYPREQVSWAAWIIGRMGGWKGYKSQKRPPGPITMKRGLEKFYTIIEAYYLFEPP